ncbi:hypothetical protein HRbin15_01628 [bacterium HR15]|nr:hypothetical protein HRbin15_01628 [bacterium HR15]
MLAVMRPKIAALALTSRAHGESLVDWCEPHAIEPQQEMSEQ